MASTRQALFIFGPASLIGGALYNVIPAPTDPIFFLLTRWLANSNVALWQYYAVLILGYYLLPGTWYMVLALVYLHAGEGIDQKLTITGIVFTVGMVLFIFYSLDNPLVNFTPDGTTVAAIAVGIVSTFALSVALISQKIEEIF